MRHNILHYAAVEMCSGVRVEDNIAMACAAIDEAKKAGADMVGLPECCNLMQLSSKEALHAARTEKEDQGLITLCQKARQLKLWIGIGSMVLAHPTVKDRLINCGFMIDQDGKIVARYRKIHLYDSEPGDGKRYRESALYNPGNQAVIAPTPWGNYGMSICYDLRFPMLYQNLAKAGAVILSVPAAFTKPTGEAHWEIMLRSRAIENACFVVAPAQAGKHKDGRETWGHSMIIDPWGKILAHNEKQQPGIIIAALDFDRINQVRRKLPVHKHQRAFDLLSPSVKN